MDLDGRVDRRHCGLGGLYLGRRQLDPGRLASVEPSGAVQRDQPRCPDLHDPICEHE